MSDAATIHAIEQAVQDKVSKRELFTAFDITKVARQSSGLRFLHRDVQLDVHEAVVRIAGSAYVRTPISIPGIPASPFLYCPLSSDPNAYFGGRVQDQRASALSVSGIITADSRGTIRIPSRFIVGLNVQPQAPVYVTQARITDANGSLVSALRITPAVPVAATSATEILVDRQSRIAISRGVLIDAGIDGQGTYKIEGSAIQIIVLAISDDGSA